MKCIFCTRQDRGGSYANPNCMFAEVYHKGEELSICCDAPAEVAGKTTNYYICSKCGYACDVAREGRGVIRRISEEYGLPLYKVAGIIKEWKKHCSEQSGVEE